MGWTFTYIGADQDVERVAIEIGVHNTLRFSANLEETNEMFRKERQSRRKFYDKLKNCPPEASRVESTDYFDED